MAEHLLPALCDRCGSIWTPNAIAVGAGATNITISNVSVGPCPACGGTGHIPDGVYEGTESGVRLVARLTPNHRRLLAELLRDAQRQNSDQDTLARALESLATGQDDSSAAIRELAGEVRRQRAADWK